MPSTEVVQYDTLSDRELMELTGFGDQGYTGISLPRLRVNFDDEDPFGNSIVRGLWRLDLPEQTALATEASVRLFNKTYQYSRYDDDEQKFVSTSVHFQKFTEEIPDSAGGFKCGKVKAKLYDELTDEEKVVQKQIKCRQVYFGLVSLDGTNGAGKKVKIKDEPMVLYARGSSYSPMDEYSREVNKRGVHPARVVTTITLRKEKNGGVTYWVMVPEKAKEVTFGKDDVALLSQFIDTVSAENEQIMDDFNKKRNKSGVLDDDIADLIEGASSDITL